MAGKWAPWKLATAKDLQSRRQVLSSQLNGKNELWAIIPDAPSVRYTGIIGPVVHYTGLINLAKKKIEGADITTTKTSTTHGGFHSSSSALLSLDSVKDY